jgi:hypothetical protein
VHQTGGRAGAEDAQRHRFGEAQLSGEIADLARTLAQRIGEARGHEQARELGALHSSHQIPQRSLGGHDPVSEFENAVTDSQPSACHGERDGKWRWPHPDESLREPVYRVTDEGRAPQIAHDLDMLSPYCSFGFL